MASAVTDKIREKRNRVRKVFHLRLFAVRQVIVIKGFVRAPPG